MPPMRDFAGLPTSYDFGMLRPRPWTAAQSAWAADLLTGAASGTALPDGPIVELCAGAGHTGMRALSGTDRHLVCVDDDPVACRCARINADMIGLGGRVAVRLAGVSEALAEEERFALVIADPPGVPHGHVARSVEDPHHAIDGGADGLDLARECVEVGRRHLLPGGALLLRLGPGESARLVAERGDGLRLVEVRKHADRGELALVVPAEHSTAAQSDAARPTTARASTAAGPVTA